MSESDGSADGTDDRKAAAPGGEGGQRRDGDNSDGADGTATGYAGPRLVVGLYVLLVLVTAAAGFLIATFVEGLESPRFLFLIPFPPTQLGFAAYGGLTLAVVLGVPLALVVLVSRRIDDES